MFSRRWSPPWLLSALGLLCAALSLIFLSALMRGAPWLERILGEERQWRLRGATESWLSEHCPLDSDADEVPDVVEILAGTSPFDFYNGRELSLLLRGRLFRKADFVYAGHSIELQVQHRSAGDPQEGGAAYVTGTAPSTRVTLDGAGGRFFMSPRHFYWENQFDPATGVLEGSKNTATGGLVWYQAPETPNRSVLVRAFSHGQRELEVALPVRILGYPLEPLPVRSVERPAPGRIRVSFESPQTLCDGIAIEFADYQKWWLIVAEAPAGAVSCDFESAVVDVNAPSILPPPRFRIVPFSLKAPRP